MLDTGKLVPKETSDKAGITGRIRLMPPVFSQASDFRVLDENPSRVRFVRKRTVMNRR
ncbi:hypothetical protein BKA14_008422 [Actinoplanes abujensis]|uniref:Uncharacterized protein n=1 Tax=Paractinoplanes abujensis TaxID=882441 RepID=A0A7W7G773_9ACTN|nr:hypothetical protein [Actinoplanes abujensis]